MRGECGITFQREATAIWGQIAGNWERWKGDIGALWGRITDEELEGIQGRYEALVGKIQQRYDVTRGEADRQVREWLDTLALTRRIPVAH